MLANVKTLPYTGKVVVNGHERPKEVLSDHARAFRKVTGYVAQGDIANGAWLQNSP